MNISRSLRGALDKIRAAAKKVLPHNPASRDPRDTTRTAPTHTPVRARSQHLSAAERMIEWCHAFNSRNGWTIPSKSARSIYLAAHKRYRTPPGAAAIKRLHKRKLALEDRAAVAR